MRQLTFVGPGEMEWRDVAAPRLQGPTEALVKPLAVSRCDLDLAILRGNAPTTAQFALGHEFTAEIIDIGASVRNVSVGDRVIVAFQISCGTCANCRRGLTRSCRSVPPLSTFGLPGNDTEYGGGFSDIVRVPFADAMLFPIPIGASPIALAPASDNLPDGFRLVAPGLTRWPGADVLVLGGGGAASCGLYAVASAIALGAARVDYVDHNQDRLSAAETIGAYVIDLKVDEQTSAMGPYPVTVDAQIKETSFYLAMRSTARDGICSSAGGYFKPSDEKPSWTSNYFSGITLQNEMVNAASELKTVLPVIQNNPLGYQAVVSNVFSVDDVENQIMTNIKPVFVMNPEMVDAMEEVILL